MNILRYLNSLPFPVTVNHYYKTDSLKEIASPEAWDTLRSSEEHFSIPTNREEWLLVANNVYKKDGHNGLSIPLARSVVSLIEKLGAYTVYSVGVGDGWLEYQIKKLRPETHVMCSEYSPESVKTLKKVFTEADEIFEHDIRLEWPSLPNDAIVIMYRVDPHLTDHEWKMLFASKPHHTILFIPNTCLTLKSVVAKYLHRVLDRGNYVFAGYVRSKEGYKSLWSTWYDTTEIQLPGMKGFLLTCKQTYQ